MPATAGRVRMPANNRVHSSAALQTHGIWQSAIGYDPYAPNKEDKKKDSSQNLSNEEPDAENAYASFQGLLQLARITNADVDVDRGACKKCGRVGHLKFQCKNYVKLKDDNEEKDTEAVQPLGLVALDKKLKGKAEKVDRRSTVESSEEEEDDSDSSDSAVDSEIERIIAERSGKKIGGKGGSSRKKGGSDDDVSDKDSSKRKGRGRSKKRSGKREISDSDDSGHRRRKRRREHRRRRDKSSDEDDDYRRRHRKSRKEKRRRRSRPSDSDSETSEDSGRRHKRKSKRASSSSDTDSSGFNDSRMGRDIKKSEKTRRRHHRDDE